MPDAPRHSLAGAEVMICGASGGLGTALAGELFARGAVLTLVGRDAGRLAAVGVVAERVVADLLDEADCARAVADAAARSGGLDIVINATGVVAFGAATELDVAVMRQLLEVNALLPMVLARAALPVLRPDGAIVNLSGVIAERPLPGMTAYSASKGALRAFDEALAREARRMKVRVLDARPPHTETGLAGRSLFGAAPALPEGLAPERVAEVICDALESGARDLPSEAF